MINKKSIIIIFTIIISVFFIGCWDESKNENNIKNIPEGEINLSEERYIIYLNNRYNAYLNNLDVDTKYSLDRGNVTSYDYIDNLKEAYRELEEKLVTLKDDLRNGVKTESEKIKNINDNIINLIDEAIIAAKNVSIELESEGDKIKDKDEETIKAKLYSIERESVNSRKRLAEKINEVKEELGIE